MALNWPERDPKFRVIKSPDVTRPESWPKAPSKYVFIFEAIDMTGRALFGEDWTCKELAAVIWQESPTQERARAHLPQGRGGGARGLHGIGTLPKPPKPRFDFHVQDWLAEKRQPLWEENGRALKRLEKATEWLAQRCRDGELTSHARFRDVGGNLWPMRAGEWNVESPIFHFVVNGGKKRYFPQLQHTGPFECFVFFEKRELLDALSREPDAPLMVGEADLSRLSPYLRLAVRVALEQGYFSKDRCETKCVREAEVTAAWPDLISDIEVVPTMVTAIAKIINFPDADAIQKGRLGGQRRKTGATPKP